MTDKELRRLSRREFLQLLLAQGKEAEKTQQELVDTQEKLRQLEEGYERLKHRLDDKDAQIHKLRAALQAAHESAGAQDGELSLLVAPTVPDPDDTYAPPVEPSQEGTDPPQASSEGEETSPEELPLEEEEPFIPPGELWFDPEAGEAADRPEDRNMQTIVAIQFVQGKAVSSSQVLRPTRDEKGGML